MRASMRLALATLLGAALWVAPGCCTCAVKSADADAGRILQAQPPAPQGYPNPKALQADDKAGKLPKLGPAALPPSDGVRILGNLEYGHPGDVSLKLDLYVPEKAAAPMPLVVFVHGGGWELKGKEYGHLWCLHHARQGYAAATVEYRNSTEATFPGAAQDVMEAVRWLRAHAGEYGYDPDRIALIGQSAGAHLVLETAYAFAAKGFGIPADPAGAKAIRAVVAYYPPTDLTAPEVRDKKVVQKFLGATYAQAPERYRLASPLAQASKKSPPTLLFHGTIDGVVPVAQSDALAQRLKELAVPCVYDRLNGWDHGMDVFVDVNRHCMAVTDAFFAEYFPLSH